MHRPSSRDIINDVRMQYNTITDIFTQTRRTPWPILTTLWKEYVKPGTVVGDLGCGTGRVADLVEANKGTYWGCDIAQRMIERARIDHPHATFDVADMRYTLRASHSCDVVCLIASVHHLPTMQDRVEALREAHRIVCDNGVVIMTNWNMMMPKFWSLRLQHVIRWIEKKCGGNVFDADIPWKNSDGHILALRHYHAFSRHEIHRIANIAGFDVIKNFIEHRGHATSILKGENIVTILRPKHSLTHSNRDTIKL